MTDTVLDRPTTERPLAFTQDQLGWIPWLAPLTEAELTDVHRAALVDKARARSPYFLLLARDPEILQARTKTDQDIFYNPSGGLPRAERELAATATSRRNGCVFCASVHARFAAHYSHRPQDVQRLLDQGVDAPQDERWQALIDAAAALTATPSALGVEHIDTLRAVGLDDLAISDLLHAAAFFNWANRLMLSLGEPTPPPTE
ncbi:alkylhydroperoxidase domain protein [Micromonospora sp. NPDC007230]|uniref:alkylhydroperoxidase domain protein n=1 Tax=Micromonospora sp. NPDC007230 TaxID=3364237 RepID=UPI00368CB104